MLSAMLWSTTRTVIGTSTSRRQHWGNVLHLRCPGRFDAPRCVGFRVMCKGNPHKPAPYLRQTASARLESSPYILGDLVELFHSFVPLSLFLGQLYLHLCHVSIYLCGHLSFQIQLIRFRFSFHFQTFRFGFTLHISHPSTDLEQRPNSEIVSVSRGTAAGY